VRRYAARLRSERIAETLAQLEEAGIEASRFPSHDDELVLELDAVTGVHATVAILGAATWIEAADLVVAPRAV
jgi:hypothetical protein